MLELATLRYVKSQQSYSENDSVLLITNGTTFDYKIFYNFYFWNTFWPNFQKALHKSQKLNKHNDDVLQCYQFIKIAWNTPCWCWARPIKTDTSGNMLRVHYTYLLFELCVKSSKILFLTALYSLGYISLRSC